MGLETDAKRLFGEARADETVGDMADVVDALRRRHAEKQAEFLANHVALDVVGAAIGYRTDSIIKIARRLGIAPVKAGVVDPGHAKFYVTREEAERIVDQASGVPDV